MDFEEWFESREDIGCLIGLEGYAAKEAWNARQAEIDELRKKDADWAKLVAYDTKVQSDMLDTIDELQKRIDDALNEIESGITGKHHVKRIIKILKGAAE